jgi:hypothetical protein
MTEGDYVVQYSVCEGHWPGGAFRGFNVPEGDYTRIRRDDHLENGRIAERWAVPFPTMSRRTRR